MCKQRYRTTRAPQGIQNNALSSRLNGQRSTLTYRVTNARQFPISGGILPSNLLFWSSLEGWLVRKEGTRKTRWASSTKSARNDCMYIYVRSTIVQRASKDIGQRSTLTYRCSNAAQFPISVGISPSKLLFSRLLEGWLVRKEETRKTRWASSFKSARNDCI